MRITSASVPEYVDVTLVARVNGADGVDLVQADFGGASDWDFEVYDENGVSVYTDTDSGNVATAVIFDTLQTDGYWGGKDSEGYNFRLTVTQTQVAMLGGKKYRHVVRLNTTSKGVIPMAWDIEMISLRPVT